MQGFPQLDPRFLPVPRAPVQPWQYAPITDDQLRNPLNIIPPDQRPRVILRFGEQRDLLASGLLDGGADIAQRPVVVDVPMEKGHVVLFGNNPVYRGETIGSYFLVFNTILHFDNLNAGRKVDAQLVTVMHSHLLRFLRRRFRCMHRAASTPSRSTSGHPSRLKSRLR